MFFIYPCRVLSSRPFLTSWPTKICCSSCRFLLVSSYFLCSDRSSFVSLTTPLSIVASSKIWDWTALASFSALVNYWNLSLISFVTCLIAISLAFFSAFVSLIATIMRVFFASSSLPSSCNCLVSLEIFSLTVASYFKSVCLFPRSTLS